MSTIKNGQISLYCHFNKIMKGRGISFRSPTLSPEHIRNVCHTAHQYLTKFYFDNTWDSKEIDISVTAYDDVTILKSVDFTKIQKTIYLKDETLVKKSLITHQGLLYCEKQFCSGGNL